MLTGLLDRSALADHLLAPRTRPLLFLGYRPAPLAGVRSMDRAPPVKNAVSTVKTIKTLRTRRGTTGRPAQERLR